MQLTLFPAGLTRAQYEAGNAALCALPAAKDPRVSQAINGDWSLGFGYALGAPGAEQLGLGLLVEADGQLYRIDSVERGSGKDGDWLSVQALHLVYDLRDRIITNIETAEMTPGGINQRIALQQVLSGSDFTDGVIDTDIVLDYLDILQKDAMWAIKEQVLPLWGGELRPDNWTIDIRKQMGADRGVHLRHGKNIRGVKLSESLDGVVTRLHILGYRNANIESINDGKDYIDSPYINNYPTIREGMVTFPDDDLPADLLSKGQEYLATVDTPRTRLTVDLAQVMASEQYAQYRDLERVALGDTVTVFNERLGVNVTARVQSREYDPTTGENLRVELGNDSRNLYAAIASAKQAAEIVKMISDRKGNLRAEMLRGVLDLLTTQLMASGSFSDAQVIEGKGILFENTNTESPDYGAMYLGPGIFAIANEKNEAGSWVWRTFGTAQGFYGSELMAGTVTTGKLAADVGAELNISSNEAITSTVGALDSLSTQVTQSNNGMLLQIQTLESLAENNRYYIYAGLLFVETDGTERYGVALGTNLTTYEDESGRTLLEKAGVSATFEGSLLAFWQNSEIVAYLSDNQLHILRANILDAIYMGPWLMDAKHGFSLKYVGEA